MRFAILGTLLLLLAAHRAEAQDCLVPIQGPLETTPASGPFPVTLDAPIKVRYSEGFLADPFIMPDSLLTVWEVDTLVPVAGRLEVIGDVLVLTPDRLLAPTTDYAGLALGRGVDQISFEFVTGTRIDLGPPELGPIATMASSPITDPCDAPDGGYRIDVTFAPAQDDGPPADLEYFLYLSRGPTVRAPELRTRVRNQSPDEVIMAFVLTPEEAAAPICVSVIAVDGVGNVDDDGLPFCDDPIKGNFFMPLCSVAAPGAAPNSTPTPWAPILALGVVWCMVRLRRV